MSRRRTAIVFALAGVVPLAVAAILACAAGASCATSPRGAPPKYPPRRPGCALRIFQSELPPLAAWDDLGGVEVICHIDDTEKTCWGRMRAEVCRMGGDIVYRMPRTPWRPKDYAMGFRGKVAHTLHMPVKEESQADGDTAFPPPASAAESAGPVIPLTGPAAPSGAPTPAATPTDAGAGAPPPDATASTPDAHPRQ